MILVWVLLAVIVGAAIGRLAGFMGVEFVIRPALLVTRAVATVLGWVSGWAKRLP